MNRSAVLTLLIFLGILGFADAVYLSANALASTPLVCDIQGLNGCNTVAASPYSRFLGIPLAVYGLVFYGAILVFTFLLKYLPKRLFVQALLLATTLGVLASVYFLYLQIWVIKALCVYCLGSALISFVLCALAYGYRRQLVPPPPVLP